MNKCVGVGFQCLATIHCSLAGPAKRALTIDPSVLGTLKPDVARITVKALGNGMRAIGVLGAVHAAPRQQASEFRDADTKHLPGQDVIHPLLQVRHLQRQALG